MPLLPAAAPTADEAHIVNVSSMAAFAGIPQNAAYSLTKGAVRSFTEALRAELVGTNVGVSTLFPGAVGTDIMDRARGAQAERLAAFGKTRIAPYLRRPPEAAARQIVRAIEHDKARVLLGPDARALDVVARDPARPHRPHRPGARPRSPDRRNRCCESCNGPPATSAARRSPRCTRTATSTLVGALVYDESKAGRDVGEVCGIGPIGVTATSDRDAILGVDADCALYMAQGEMDPTGALDDICALLSSGKNVVSTALTALIYPKSAGDEVVDRLEAACAAGGTCFHGTGIEPGWAGEVLPLTMSGVLGRVESILVQELMDYSTYDVPEMMFDIMGFGQAPDVPVPLSDPELAGSVFRAPLLMVADGLGAEVERFEFRREVAVAAEPVVAKFGTIEAGTVSAQRFSCTAIVGGREALTIEHITRVGADQAPDWPTGRGWRVTVEGVPSMILDSTIAVHGEDDTRQGCLATAMHAVHAIAPVCAAEPGIRTFLDLPMICGRGVLDLGAG